MAVVRHHAMLGRPAQDGSSAGAHLREAARRGDVRARHDLLAPVMPVAVAYLLEWWTELAMGRAEGFSGPGPITYQQIESWSRLTGQCPAPRDVRALLMLDAAWRVAARGGGPDAKDDGPKKLKPSSKGWPTKKAEMTDG